MSDPLAPYFVGAFGENNALLEETLLELVRDHVFWRRNFHPDDEPPISTGTQFEPDYQTRVAAMKRELHRLTAQLKRSVPTFHPRYLGHMLSDLLLPGLVAQLVTTLYNPNNIVEEVAPVTLALEHEVGDQLATLMGFSCNSQKTPCAMGHLTSGGTLANDEALWLARAVKLLPLALKDACAAVGRWPIAALNVDDVTLLEWPGGQSLDAMKTLCVDEPLARAIAAHRVESVGLASFAQRHPLILNLTVFAPATAHYSWNKAMRLLGLGSARLQLVPTRNGRLDTHVLRERLQACRRERTPVLALIGVYGTTEFGAFDPIDELVSLRAEYGAPWLHVDAAWGGYVPTVFRAADGSLRPRAEVARDFAHFPSERVYRATAALADADSVTVDPHKLGFVPYGAGAFVVRDRRALGLSVQEAAYLFHQAAADDGAYRNAARFSLEGSRPGAAAAAVAINHRVLPLDRDHFGQLIVRSVKAAEAVVDAVPSVRAKLERVAHIAVPFEPDCNVVGLALNPWSNGSLAQANRFARTVYESLRVHPEAAAGGTAAFFGSCTTVPLNHLGQGELARLASLLGLDLQAPDDDGLFVLRHTLMNPWLFSSPVPGSPNYLARYLDYLVTLVQHAATAGGGVAP